MQENILFEGLPPNKRTELMKNSIFKKAKKNSKIDLSQSQTII